MRTFRCMNVAVLSLLVGSAGILYAQDQKQEDNHPAQEARPENKQDTARPENKQDTARPESRQDTAPPDARTAHPEATPAKPEDRRAQEQAAPDRDHPQARPEEKTQEHPEQPADRAHDNHPEQARNMQGGHGRIPDDQFRSHFGREHHFRAQGVIVAGRPNFSYQGYNFELANPWPAGWAYSDDCYVDYIDGQYYLIDLAHPGLRLALVIM